MPSLKAVIITTIISLLIGGGLFFAIQQGRGVTPLPAAIQKLQSSPTPTPTATPIPIDSSTNLEGEINQQQPGDYSNLYQNLKLEVENF